MTDRPSIESLIEQIDRFAPERFRANPDWASLPLFDRTGWKRLPFEAFAQNVNERVEPADAADEIYVGLEHLDTGSLHLRRWGKGSDVTGTKLRFRKGDIIFARRRAYQRKLAVAEFDGICSAHAMVVRAKTELVLPEFLPFLMMSERFMNRAVEISVGSLSPTINWTTLRNEEFELPPIEQQHRIATILHAVDAVILGGDAVEETVITVHQTILNTFAEHHVSIHASATLNDVLPSGRPICYGILKPGLDVQNGIPVIKVKDYPEGYVRERELLHTTEEIEAPYKRSRLREGDLLLSIRGTIGRVAAVPVSLDGANITQDTARISIDPKHNAAYIRALLESEFVQAQIKSRTTGLAVKGINIGDVRQIRIPLPSRDVQDVIADQVTCLTHARSVNVEHLRAALAVNRFLIEKLG